MNSLLKTGHTTRNYNKAHNIMLSAVFPEKAFGGLVKVYMFKIIQHDMICSDVLSENCLNCGKF